MKFKFRSLLAVWVGLCLQSVGFADEGDTKRPSFRPKDVLKEMQRVADWQLDTWNKDGFKQQPCVEAGKPVVSAYP